MDLDARPLRWGICGSGHVCHDFVNAIQSLPEDKHLVYAVGDSEQFQEKAKRFAEDFNIPHVYGSFETIAEDPNVDIYYCGVVNTMHYPLAAMLLKKKRNVLVEKPLSVKRKMVEELLALAKENDVFFMEAMWMKMFPALREAMKLIAEGHVGKVRSLSASAGFFPTKYNVRHIDPQFWGGALADMGCYTVHLAAMVFKCEEPQEMKVVSVPMDTGVDESTSITLKFKGGETARLYGTIGHKLPCEAVIGGTKGFITICDPVWCPEEIRTPDGTKKFPLPPPSTFSKTMKHPNSEGMVYEVEEVYRCLKAGRKESELCPHKESLFAATIIERVWEEIGYKVN